MAAILDEAGNALEDQSGAGLYDEAGSDPPAARVAFSSRIPSRGGFLIPETAV